MKLEVVYYVCWLYCVCAGIPERNIPPIEPLSIPMVMLQQGTSAVNYKADLKDIKVYGLRNYQFKNIVSVFSQIIFYL